MLSYPDSGYPGYEQCARPVQMAASCPAANGFTWPSHDSRWPNLNQLHQVLESKESGFEMIWLVHVVRVHLIVEHSLG